MGWRSDNFHSWAVMLIIVVAVLTGFGRRFAADEAGQPAMQPDELRPVTQSVRWGPDIPELKLQKGSRPALMLLAKRLRTARVLRPLGGHCARSVFEAVLCWIHSATIELSSIPPEKHKIPSLFCALASQQRDVAFARRTGHESTFAVEASPRNSVTATLRGQSRSAPANGRRIAPA